jgi:DNA-directed RNA polymerase specialized sigma24 family protein
LLWRVGEIRRLVLAGSYWQREGNRLRLMPRSKNFAAPTGGHFTGSSGAKAIDRRMRRISLKLFLRGCSSGGNLETVKQERGRLRSYLLASLKNFLSKARHRELTVKRGEGRPLVSLEDLLARERADQEPSHKLSADRIYERRWALTLLEQVLARLRAEYEAAGKLPLFDRLKELLARESGQPSQAEIAAEMQMTENAVKQAFHRLRHRYRQLLHEEIAHTVAVPDDVEDELRHFISVLQA